MLDKKTDMVLHVLSQHATNGYSVLEKQTLIDAMPPKFKMNMEEFCNIVAFLKENGYVDVKYQDKTTICLSVTVKTQNHLEGGHEITEKTKIIGGQFGVLLLWMFLCSFLGGFLALILYNVIF